MLSATWIKGLFHPDLSQERFVSTGNVILSDPFWIVTWWLAVELLTIVENYGMTSILYIVTGSGEVNQIF